MSVDSSERERVPISRNGVGCRAEIEPASGNEGKADSNPSVKQEEKEEEGEGKEGGTEERREQDDSLEADFKQSKKRFRTPGASGPVSSVPIVDSTSTTLSNQT